MPTLNLRLLFLLICCMVSLFPLEAWGGKQGQESPDLPQSITLRARVVKNNIVDNEAKAQIKRYDEEVYKQSLIYEFQRFTSQTPFYSISFIYEENGFFEENGKDCIFYGKKCGKGELLLPETNIIYTKPYLSIEDGLVITEYRDYTEGCAYYLFPFGVSIKGDGPIHFYYPYAGMISNGNDITGAEQAYFSLDRISYTHETGISRAFHSDLASEGIDCLAMGSAGWGKTNSRDKEYHRSVFDIPEEQGISAGAALCGGYAKFEYIQQTPKGPLRKVYKSFQYTHPGNNSNLVDIFFVQDLDHDTLPDFVNPLPLDISIDYLNNHLLKKLQETFQEKIRFVQEDLLEIEEQGHVAKVLSPFWEDIQSSLIATAKFIDQYPLLADLTINGLQFIMGGPFKFAITKIADYLAIDLIENSKEKAQKFLVEQLGVPPDQIELATAAIGMGVDLFLSRPANVLKSARKVIEAAERRAIKRNLLPSLDLAKTKKALTVQKKLSTNTISSGLIQKKTRLPGHQRTLDALDLEKPSKITREKRWLQLANESNSRLPKEVIDHINRHNGRKVSYRFGLELAHKPKKAACQGHDYKEAIPKTTADHRGIQHKFLKERKTGTTITIPTHPKEGKLSLPTKGDLPK